MAGSFRRVAALTALTVVPVGALAAEQHGGFQLSDLHSISNAVNSAISNARAQVQQGVNNLHEAAGRAGSSDQNGGVAGNGTAQGPADGTTSGEVAGSVPEVTGVAITSQPGAVMIRTVLPGGEAAGSGIVWKSNGTILTNYHVIKGSTQIQVTVADGSTHTASMVGYSASKDIAVLKINDTVNLTAAQFDTTPTMGESVHAVGQGGGKGVLYRASGSVTALNQSITASERGDTLDVSSEKLTGLIQTNAPIVSGYSGGPLFDADGEVIGIDTAASGSTPISGFAIPSAKLLSVANDIASGKSSGEIRIGRHGALGVQVASGSVTDDSGAAGVVVQRVADGSGALAAGISPGDAITAIDGHSVTSATALTKAVSAHDPGDKVSVTWTDASGASVTKPVTLTDAATN